MTTSEPPYEIFEAPGAKPVKAWVRGVPVEDAARKQLLATASLPFVHQWVAAMPDVHLGIGATVGSVVATRGAVIPAAVGVDIGCGMMAVETSLRADQLPDDLAPLRGLVERAVPHGRTDHGGPNDRGAWREPRSDIVAAWRALEPGYRALVEREATLDRGAPPLSQLGTLGGGNHFIELCLDERDHLWVMLHSGSRGVGNRIGQRYIELAKLDMRRVAVNLPDADLAYFEEGAAHFDDYLRAVGWAQDYARVNRERMMAGVLDALARSGQVPPFTTGAAAVNCHHNYVAREHHYGADVLVTRKGAVRARRGDLGIIPGSMGARSFIVRGKGAPESFCSCSHGAGRRMSRGEAKRRFTLADHEAATRGVECRKDAGVIDETPGAYKDIDAVMAAQSDLVEVVHTLRQIVCVKG